VSPEEIEVATKVLVWIGAPTTLGVLGRCLYLLHTTAKALEKVDAHDALLVGRAENDEWGYIETRRRLQAGWKAIERLQESDRKRELEDAGIKGELNSLEKRVAEHASRTISNGQEGYRKLFRETLDQQDALLRRLESMTGGKGE